MDTCPAPPSFKTGEFSLDEVISLKHKMSSSAPSPDGIHYPFWKMLAAKIDLLPQGCGKSVPSFWSTFLDLSNQVCQNGTHSHGFKDANLSLFSKKGDPTLVSNYWPISSMNTDCKMCTNLVNNRLSPWAVLKLHPDQKGFIPNRHITEHTQLASEVVHLSSRLGCNGYLISLDQLKAYNRVDQHLLLGPDHDFHVVPSGKSELRLDANGGRLARGGPSALCSPPRLPPICSAPCPALALLVRPPSARPQPPRSPQSPRSSPHRALPRSCCSLGPALCRPNLQACSGAVEASSSSPHEVPLGSVPLPRACLAFAGMPGPCLGLVLPPGRLVYLRSAYRALWKRRYAPKTGQLTAASRSPAL
jgi:Reverse transcriptase (RNA-dependent DNA polymerase)